MSGQYTPRPAPVKPGDSLEQGHIDVMVTTLSQLREAPAFAKEGYACGGALCVCDGDDDCEDMFETAGCGDIAQCYTQDGGGVICVCLTI